MKFHRRTLSSLFYQNFEDEVYLERHKKPENEEKKRKR